jgi:hypothetical protein
MHAAATVLVAALLFGGFQPARPTDPWASYRFLIGTWTGEGEGQPGNTTGTATFTLDLDGRILVRTSRANVPASARGPAYVHEDRLVVYRDAPGQPMRAMYWDNEDHAIAYDVSAPPDGNTVTFVTKPNPAAPRFRLVYTRLDGSRVDVKFEMAPPGSPEAFKVYTQGVTRKVDGGPSTDY